MNPWWQENIGVVLLSIAAAGWYLAVTTASAALVPTRGTSGRRALASWFVMLPTVVIAILIGRYEIAVDMIFATSVASMTLVLGIITLGSSTTQSSLPHRAWGLLLPLALIMLLIGLSSGFTWVHTALLAIEGLVILFLWPEPATESIVSPAAGSFSKSRKKLLGVAIIFAIIAGLIAVYAAQVISRKLGLPSSGIVTVLMLTPLMVLPMIGIGLQDATEGRSDHAVGTQIGFVFLNLCATLPLATMLWFMRQWWHAMPDGDPPIPLPYPLAIWRVDTVLLVAIGFLLLPVSLGRWKLLRIEGALLVLTYVIYLMMTVLAARTAPF